jgi:hypothetical protein
MIVLINYADRQFKYSQKLNAQSGLHVGKVDRVVSYGPRDIDRGFCQRNERILCQRRGGGYWLWKPYFIARTLNEMTEGDVLFYCDAGACFIRPVAPLVDLFEPAGQDVLPFELEQPERIWSKRDAFVLLGCDCSKFTEERQRLASYSLWRVSAQSRALATELLWLAQDERLLTDVPNTCGLPNHPGFIEHRHDQSIFSLLTKKYGLKAWRDPSQSGNQALLRHPDSTYPQIIWHTRYRV